jgi:hypothetical protein
MSAHGAVTLVMKCLKEEELKLLAICTNCRVKPATTTKGLCVPCYERPFACLKCDHSDGVSEEGGMCMVCIYPDDETMWPPNRRTKQQNQQPLQNQPQDKEGESDDDLPDEKRVHDELDKALVLAKAMVDKEESEDEDTRYPHPVSFREALAIATASGKRASKRKSEAEHEETETAKKAKSVLARAIESGEKFTVKEAWSLFSAFRYNESTDPILYCEELDELFGDDC